MNEPTPYSYLSNDSAYVSPSIVSNEVSGTGNRFGPTSIKQDDSGYSSMTRSLSSPSISSSNACNCVQHHAELLHSLKSLDQSNATPRLDVVLSAAQQALVPWKDVIECRVCRYDDNQEVLMRSAMSIRTVLGAMSSLCTDYYSNFVPGREMLGKQRSLVQTPDGMRSAIGFFEITGNERMAVTDLLISRTLDKVKYTLVRFKERLETVKARRPAVSMTSPFERPYYGQTKVGHDVETHSMGETGDLNRLLQVWQNLETTVRMLEEIMKKGKSMSIHAPGRDVPQTYNGSHVLSLGLGINVIHHLSIIFFQLDVLARISIRTAHLHLPVTCICRTISGSEAMYTAFGWLCFLLRALFLYRSGSATCLD